MLTYRQSRQWMIVAMLLIILFYIRLTWRMQSRWNSTASTQEDQSRRDMRLESFVTSRRYKKTNYSLTQRNPLLARENIQWQGTQMARAWPPTHNHTWCAFPHMRQGPPAGMTRAEWKEIISRSGLLYVKMPKSASTTLAAVTRRISYEHGARLARNHSWFCAFKDPHVVDVGRFYGNRSRHHSFLWTSVRDPAKRAISRAYFSKVSLQHQTITSDELVIQWLHDSGEQYGCISKGRGGFTLQYASLQEIRKYSAYNDTQPEKVLEPQDVLKHIQRVLDDYDFIALAERMDESIVALQLLLDVQTSDLMTINAKVGGSYSYHKKSKQCKKLLKSHVSPGVQAYLDSDEWYAQNYGDYVLYAAANRSLDKTIHALGRKRFEKALADYRALKNHVQDQCADRVIEPCTKDGKEQLDLSKSDCYSLDIGCGLKCLSEVLPPAFS